ncbi:DUF3300 domain-containing protein [Shewanella sp. YIC-542]|uniref:DUF3300 domain-containing protein n=1 Tax=Shewanella mytili TaxID=3377111 RepID=UPI00398F6655
MHIPSPNAKRLAPQMLLWLLLLLTLGSFSQPAVSGNESQSRYYPDAQLAQMLAPIALYPDTLLSHVLIASSYPLEVVAAQRWRQQHASWSNNRLTGEGAKQGWDPSVVALLAFPNILDKMSDDLNWTADLGEAFVADEGRVMDSIQTLRQAAQDADSLQNVRQIQTKRENNRIVIVPADPQVIWVPYYDPRIVYGTWRWQSYPPFYWDPFPGYVVAPHTRFYWYNSGIRISFNFFFSRFHWHERNVWVDYRRNHYRYEPYRSSISSGGQRWRHQMEHRRGVHYRHQSVQQRYAPSHPRHDIRRQVQLQHKLHHAQSLKERRVINHETKARAPLNAQGQTHRQNARGYEPKPAMKAIKPNTMAAHNSASPQRDKGQAMQHRPLRQTPAKMERVERRQAPERRQVPAVKSRDNATRQRER